MVLRLFTNSFAADFKPEKAALYRHLETLKNETTLGHRLHVHKFIAENRAQANAYTSLPIDIEEVRTEPFPHCLSDSTDCEGSCTY